MNDNKVKVTVDLPKVVIEYLKKRAQEKGVSIDDLVNNMLESFIEGLEDSILWSERNG